MRTRLGGLVATALLLGACGGGTAATPDAAVPDAPIEAAPEDAAVAAPLCGMFAPVDQACDDCREANCCAVGQACADDPDCQPFAQCMSACVPTDYECRRACVEQVDPARVDAVSLAAAVLACIGASCRSECGIPCGDFAAQPQACADCVESACCAEAIAASGTPASRSLGICVSAVYAQGGDPAVCWNRYREGAGEYWAWQMCMADECGTPCEMTPPVCGGWLWSEPACQTCMYQQATCCDLADQCSRVASCNDFSWCFQNCLFDQACRQACIDAATDEGLGHIIAMTACQGMNCATECGFTFAACGAWRSPDDLLNMTAVDPTSECYACLETNCCAEVSVLNLDPDVMALHVCVYRCAGDQECTDACAATYPDAVPLRDAVMTCYADHCLATCES